MIVIWLIVALSAIQLTAVIAQDETQTSEEKFQDDVIAFLQSTLADPTRTDFSGEYVVVCSDCSFQHLFIRLFLPVSMCY